MNLEQKAEQIVKENFEGLDDLIEDKDILGWYKELIKTCLLEFRKSSVHNSDEIPVASGNSTQQEASFQEVRKWAKFQFDEQFPFEKNDAIKWMVWKMAFHRGFKQAELHHQIYKPFRT